MHPLRLLTLPMLWRSARLPLFALLIVISLRVVWVWFGIPEQGEELAILSAYIQQYGLPLVLVGSFLEALLVVGWYFPGSFLIFISVIAAPTRLVAVESIAVVAVGLFAGYTANFFIGKYGWHTMFLKLGLSEQLADAQRSLERRGERALALSYWNPGLGAFTSTAAGILQLNTTRFLIVGSLATIGWCIFWGIIVSFLGERAIPLMFSWTFVLTALFVWWMIRTWSEITDVRSALQQNDQPQHP